MVAELDLLLIAVYRIADDFLPERGENARRKLADAEVVTLCIARRSWESPPTSGCSRSRAGALRTCSRSFPSTRRSQASAAALWPDRGADRALRAPEPSLLLRSAVGRLHRGGVERARFVETVKRGGASSLTDALANAYDSCARGRLRVDTTLLEADIRSPTGSEHCAHAVSRLTGLARRMKSTGAAAKAGLRDRRRSVAVRARKLSAQRAVLPAIDRLTAEIARARQIVCEARTWPSGRSALAAQRPGLWPPSCSASSTRPSRCSPRKTCASPAGARSPIAAAR